MGEESVRVTVYPPVGAKLARELETERLCVRRFRAKKVM